MGTIVSHIHDKIQEHGSLENYMAELEKNLCQTQGDCIIQIPLDFPSQVDTVPDAYFFVSGTYNT